MAFGLAIVASVTYGALRERSVFMTAGGLFVGSLWFAFGKYGVLADLSKRGNLDRQSLSPWRRAAW